MILMKKLLLLLLLAAPAVMNAQSSFGLQIYRTGSDLAGKDLSAKSENGWSAGAWIEKMHTETFGVKTSVSYMQRRASIEGVALNADVFVVEVMPRIRISDMDNEWARLIVGAGLYSQVPKSNNNSLIRDYDLGFGFELGWDLGDVVVMGTAQKSILDVSALSGKQRWVSFGLGLQFVAR